jgi:hypothetical protein
MVPTFIVPVKIMFSSSVGLTGNVVFCPGALVAGSCVCVICLGVLVFRLLSTGMWVSTDAPSGYVGLRLLCAGTVTVGGRRLEVLVLSSAGRRASERW